MAVKVIVLVVIQLCWTVAQSDTQPRDVTHHNASTQDFEVCEIRSFLNITSKWKFTVHNKSSVYSIDQQVSATDLWTSNCKVIYGTEIVSGFNALQHYLDQISVVNISSSKITRFKNDFFCDFPRLFILRLPNNDLDEVTKLGLDLDYNCSKSSCAHQLFALSLSGNPLKSLKNNSFCQLRRLEILDLNNCELTFIEPGAFIQVQNLWILRVSNNRLKHLPSQLFLKTPQLEYLYINNNSLLVVPRIRHLTKLDELSLSFNDITSVKKMDFINCTKLYLLDLSHNTISNIEEGAFDSLNYMSKLNLSNNQLQTMSVIFLYSKMYELDLNNNQLTYIDFNNFPRNLRQLHSKGNLISRLLYTSESIFDKFADELALVSIDLRNNNFTKLDSVMLPHSVRDIDLSDNHITQFSFNPKFISAFGAGYSLLQTVYLENNNFSVVKMLPHRYIGDNRVIPMYYFDGNPLQCSCENVWLLRTSRMSEIEHRLSCSPLATIKASHLYPKDNILSTSQLCESNYDNSNRCQIDHTNDYHYELQVWFPNTLAIECQFKCPPPCYCYTTFNFSVVHLYCSQLQLKMIPQLLDKEKLSSESEVNLWLDGNNFNTINATDFHIFTNVVQLYLNHSHIHAIHPLAFDSLTVLRVLNLSDNNLQTLPVGLFHHLTMLQQLYLSHNRLKDLDDTIKNLLSLEILHLHNNQLSRFAVWNLKMPSLKELTLHNNNWSCDCGFVMNFQEYLKHSTIVHNPNMTECITQDGRLSKVSIINFDGSVCEFHETVISAVISFGWTMCKVFISGP